MSQPRVFHLILANNLVQNLVNFTVWFALVFWAFLETRSVFVTGMIGGIYLVLGAVLAPWFGSLVDHHAKWTVMLASSIASFVLYAIALGVVLIAPPAALSQVDSAPLWVFTGIAMLGVIAGNLRMIALPTLVTALIPPEGRDKANGLVGMVSGLGFLITSAISGFLVAWDGMRGTLALALVATVLAFGHMLTIRLAEPRAEAAEDDAPRRVDLSGTLAVIRAVPGLGALILFACFNNLLGGVFMALMDAYGLSLMSVEAWGLLWAGASSAFIVSGLIIAKAGLGPNPLRTLMLVNLVVWLVAALFSVQSSILLLGIGCVLWLALSPFAEAAEQTALQQVVPFERQGRVFGFAQAVENSAAPLMAVLIGPVTQYLAIPFMTDGAGAAAVGHWYGTGPERGMALVFTLTGVAGMALTLAAMASGSYRALSAAVREASARPA
ncbi:MFS transporter [Porphyrobacter sp. SLTP]|uniref:MFS transporter n=1 Tax=Porphyrobacter sp. SLTP TaxID=2683266 RepID=UPI0014136621|nr:MFS transporter [Porphyrobacter sp. SLTP]NBB25055.1 MFS transporter [Porphyrobacter sp. SLTP]